MGGTLSKFDSTALKAFTYLGGTALAVVKQVSSLAEIVARGRQRVLQSTFMVSESGDYRRVWTDLIQIPSLPP